MAQRKEEEAEAEAEDVNGNAFTDPYIVAQGRPCLLSWHNAQACNATEKSKASNELHLGKSEKQ